MPNIIFLAGLGFGDEGKGSCTDLLCRLQNVSTVVRFSGGAQCGHNVVLPNGIHHTFAQFGSGTLAGAKTHLSHYMLVNPFSLQREAKALSLLVPNPYSLLTIEREALVTNPFQVAANRIREIQRGRHHHGSCGMGIGETTEDSLTHPDMAIRIKDLQDAKNLREKLEFSRDLKTNQLGPFPVKKENPWQIFQDEQAVNICVERYTEIAKKINIVDDVYLGNLLKTENVLFEGAQGVLLDQDYGFHPHTTWTDTTFGNADRLLVHAGYAGEVRRIGVLRGYMTRHGAGPLPTEMHEPEVGSDADNCYGVFQEHFRVGHFDAVLVKYALDVIGDLDEVILTNLDKIGDHPKICDGYFDRPPQEGGATFKAFLPVHSNPVNLDKQAKLTELLFRIEPLYRILRSKEELVRAIAELLSNRVSLCSYGPTYKHKLPFQDYLRIINDKYAMPTNSAFVLGL